MIVDLSVQLEDDRLVLYHGGRRAGSTVIGMSPTQSAIADAVEGLVDKHMATLGDGEELDLQDKPRLIAQALGLLGRTPTTEVAASG